jgi:hypothetical protein
MENTAKQPTKTQFILNKLFQNSYCLEEDLDKIYDLTVLLGTMELCQGGNIFDTENAHLFHFLIGVLREMKNAEKEYHNTWHLNPAKLEQPINT